MKLHNYWRSSASWRVRIALELKNAPFDYVPVHLVDGGGWQYRDQYRTLNPMAQVPTLELGDDRSLSQSLAIIEYLEETIPSPALLPKDPYLRARARQLAEIVNAGIQPLQNLAVFTEVKRLGGDTKAWAQLFIDRGLRALEASAQKTTGTFLVGDSPTIADICLVPQLYNARRFEIELTPFPTLTRIEAECAKIDAFARAHADRQPDATP